MITLAAPAKINLGLQILGKRDDGYHEINTIMAALSLADVITIERSDAYDLSTDAPDLAGEPNLVDRVVDAVSARGRGIFPSIAIQKRIPIAAGLGGASSDAAAALLGLNSIYELSMNSVQLSSLGATIGSDVPFFFTGGFARARGRGEIIESLAYPGDRHLILVVPNLRIPAKTATLYAALTPDDFVPAFRETEAEVMSILDDPGGQLSNAFERPLYALAPRLKELREVTARITERDPALSGAGPAHFVIEADLDRACYITTKLRETLLDEATVILTGFSRERARIVEASGTDAI